MRNAGLLLAYSLLVTGVLAIVVIGYMFREMLDGIGFPF
jgi:hypothetical protein